MEQAGDKGARVRQGRKGLAVAALVTISGILLIYVANNTLSAATPGQALVAYVGVFVVAAGILYGASTLLVPE
jgi:drug/metabolite transporter superfamily protein YnfA